MSVRSRVTRLALLLVGLGWLALAHPQAQTAPTLEWQHDGVNVTWFACVIDGGAAASLGLPTPTGDPAVIYSAPLSSCGTLTSGQHEVVIQACNFNGCVAAATLYVVKL